MEIPRKKIFGTNSCLDHTYFYYTAGGGGNKDKELDKCWSYNIHTFPSTCTRILPNYNHKWLIVHAKHIEDDLLYCNPRISLTLSAFKPEPLAVIYCRKPLYFTSQDLLLPSSAQVLSPSWAELSFNPSFSPPTHRPTGKVLRLPQTEAPSVLRFKYHVWEQARGNMWHIGHQR